MVKMFSEFLWSLQKFAKFFVNELVSTGHMLKTWPWKSNRLFWQQAYACGTEVN